MTHYKVCSDCYVYVANADDSGLDLLPPNEAEARRIARDLTLVEVGYLVPNGAELGFCRSDCDLCGAEAGDRFGVTDLEST